MYFGATKLDHMVLAKWDNGVVIGKCLTRPNLDVQLGVSLESWLSDTCPRDSEIQARGLGAEGRIQSLGVHTGTSDSAIILAIICTQF